MAASGCQRKEYEKKEKDGSLTDIQKEDYLTPGPFSFLDYMLHLLERNSWGDYGVALSCSLMWQIRVTIVVVDTRGKKERESGSGRSCLDMRRHSKQQTSSWCSVVGIITFRQVRAEMSRDRLLTERR